MHSILQQYGKRLTAAIEKALSDLDMPHEGIRFTYAGKPSPWQLLFTLPYAGEASCYEKLPRMLPSDECLFEFVPPVSLRAYFGAKVWTMLAADAAALTPPAMPTLLPEDALFYPQHAYLHLARRISPVADFSAEPDKEDLALLYELLTRPGATISKKLTRKYSRGLCLPYATPLFAAANIRLYGDHIAGLMG